MEPTEVRTAGDGRTVDATVCTYNVVDTYSTMFAAGCFQRSLQDRLPTLCWSHQWDRPLGRATEVLEDSATRLRLRFRLDDPERVPDVRQALAQLESGTVAEVSVGFRPEQVVPTTVDGVDVPTFTRCWLDEVSLVIVAAVPGARVDQVRSPGALAAIPRDMALGLLEQAHAQRILRERGLWPTDQPTLVEQVRAALDTTDRVAALRTLADLAGAR